MIKKIVCLYKAGRKERLKYVPMRLVPLDFFYGVLGLDKKKYEITISQGNLKIKSIREKIKKSFELLYNKILKLGIEKLDKIYLQEVCYKKHTIISFSDGLSLSLGKVKYLQNIKKIGCFHCLSELDKRTNSFFRSLSCKIIKKSLDNLEHIAFFGFEDREVAIKKFNINKNKTSIIKFGVDTNFWKPSNEVKRDYFFSAGQDPQRDFNTLMRVNLDYQIHIHTELKINSSRQNIKITNGSFYNRKLSDAELRELYQNSIAVIVPLKDVIQPSGYSVTLQAMSCGKPVIITNTKGLWDKKLLINNYNCVLVEPYSSESLTKAMDKIMKNQIFSNQLGLRARKLVENNYNMRDASSSLERLLNK